MKQNDRGVSRRTFLGALAATGAASGVTTGSTPEQTRKVKLGFDHFSIRALRWKADRILDYAAELEVDSVLFSDLDVYENHSPSYLKRLRSKAADLGIAIQAGTGSICPTASNFKDRWGTAEEHLALTLNLASQVGSTVARCYLGSRRDRSTLGGIRSHMANTVKVCRANKTLAQDLGVTIAIENHAGDLQSGELVELIEEAGSDYVGATMDSGNATWTLESPMDNLENLGPYAVSAGIRDSAIWEDETGAQVQWMAMGEGHVDWASYLDRFRQLCPECPFQLEIISGARRGFPYLEKSFWSPYKHIPAPAFAGFVAMAREGTPVAEWKPDPEIDRQIATERFQREQLEKSIRYCRDTLKLGLK